MAPRSKMKICYFKCGCLNPTCHGFYLGDLKRSVCTFVNLKKCNICLKMKIISHYRCFFFFFDFLKITNKAPIWQVLHKVSLSCVTFKENSSYAVTQLGVYDRQMMDRSSTSAHWLPLNYRVCINQTIWIIKTKVAPWCDCAVFFLFFFIRLKNFALNEMTTGVMVWLTRPLWPVIHFELNQLEVNQRVGQPSGLLVGVLERFALWWPSSWRVLQKW